MDQRISDQLDKVLAMADSSHDGEAIVAVRKARQLLSRGGLSFSDLARAVSMTRPRRAFSLFSGQQMHVESQLVQMRQRIDDLSTEMHTQSVQLEFWRRRATELEQNASQNHLEALRWRRLAQDTVDKLWDIGQSINIEEFNSDQPAAETAESLESIPEKK